MTSGSAASYRAAAEGGDHETIFDQPVDPARVCPRCHGETLPPVGQDDGMGERRCCNPDCTYAAMVHVTCRGGPVQSLCGVFPDLGVIDLPRPAPSPAGRLALFAAGPAYNLPAQPDTGTIDPDTGTVTPPPTPPRQEDTP